MTMKMKDVRLGDDVVETVFGELVTVIAIRRVAGDGTPVRVQFPDGKREWYAPENLRLPERR